MNGKRKLESWKMNLKKFRLIGLDTNIFSYHFHNHPQFVRFTDIVFTAKLSKVKAFITNDNRLKTYPGLKIILLSEVG